MMRILVVDDEPPARQGLIERLARHGDVLVIGECGHGEAAESAIHDLAPDLVFMDIQMPGPSGLDVLARIRPERRPLAIMLTAYAEHALRAFEVRAIDYLVKPLDEERLAEALDRAREQLERIAGPAAAAAPAHAFATLFACRVGQRVRFVNVEEIDWVEAMGDYAGLHAGEDVHLIREPMHRLAEQLDPAIFLRVHRSIMVRLDRIAELRSLPNRDGMLLLRDGTALRVSRTYADALRASLAAR